MPDPAIFGLNLFGDPVRPPSRGPVADAFIEPPFTVLDARSGDWQDRKRAWAAMGIQGEVGRGEDLAGASWGAEWMARKGDWRRAVAALGVRQACSSVLKNIPWNVGPEGGD